MLLLPTDACSAVTAAVARASASIAQCPACDSAVAPDNVYTVLSAVWSDATPHYDATVSIML